MKELYTIAWAKKGSGEPEYIIPPMDHNDHADQGMLVYKSYKAAQMAADYQTEIYADEEWQMAIVIPLVDAMTIPQTRHASSC